MDLNDCVSELKSQWAREKALAAVKLLSRHDTIELLAWFFESAKTRSQAAVGEELLEELRWVQSELDRIHEAAYDCDEDSGLCRELYTLAERVKGTVHEAAGQWE